jgi:hypothetical protein
MTKTCLALADFDLNTWPNIWDFCHPPSPSQEAGASFASHALGVRNLEQKKLDKVLQNNRRFPQSSSAKSSARPLIGASLGQNVK